MDLSTTDLAEAIFREKVLSASQQSPSEKWALCFELHDLAIATMRSGIAAQDPELDEAEITAELNRRLRIRRQLAEHGIYVPLPDEEAPTPRTGCKLGQARIGQLTYHGSHMTPEWWACVQSGWSRPTSPDRFGKLLTIPLTCIDVG